LVSSRSSRLGSARLSSFSSYAAARVASASASASASTFSGLENQPQQPPAQGPEPHHRHQIPHPSSNGLRQAAATSSTTTAGLIPDFTFTPPSPAAAPSTGAATMTASVSAAASIHDQLPTLTVAPPPEHGANPSQEVQADASAWRSQPQHHHPSVKLSIEITQGPPGCLPRQLLRHTQDSFTFCDACAACFAPPSHLPLCTCTKHQYQDLSHHPSSISHPASSPPAS
ncbi:hypothetical protein CF327_g7811, partial [Tilletia walkeri]